MIKTRSKANLIRGLADNEGLATQLATYQTRYGDWRELFRSVDRIDQVTKADIRRIAAIKEGDVVVGNRTKVKIVKNKVAAPFREAEFDIIYGEGISREGDLIDLGVAQNLVEKSGSWYSYNGERIGQGRENARQFLKDNPDIRQQIDTALRKALGFGRKEPEAAAPSPVPPPVEAAKPASAARSR